MTAMCMPRSGSMDLLGSVSMQQPETNTGHLLYTIPALCGNVGIIFIKGDLKEDREETNTYKDPIKYDASVASLIAKVEENEEEDNQFASVDDIDDIDDMIEKCGWIDFSAEI